ncbi:MAG: glycosyltransferase family 1 protein [Planctomycetota bacterium]|nr:MAG: glycosyltransferase family 1 protein [Planctomycetota bacterium]
MQYQKRSINLAVNCRFLSQTLTGAQRAAVELCKQIKRLEPSTVFLSPGNILHKELAETLGVKTIGKLTGHLWEQFDLPRFLKKHGKPVLLNLCNMAPLSYRSNVITIHDLSPLRSPSWFSYVFRTYYKRMLPVIARKALKVFTDSAFSKREISELLSVPEAGVTVIHLAVPENILQLADRNFPNENGKYILAVSSIDPRKNFSRLAKAFLRLKLHDTKLILVGGKNAVFSDAKLGSILHEAENIVFAGYIDDVELVALYRNALCLAYPSLYEGFGLPPLEAMACKCPVVVSETASLPEVCADAAYYVDPYNVDSIAEGIYKVATDDQLRKTLIEKGAKRVTAFSWEKSAQKLLESIKQANDS